MSTILKTRIESFLTFTVGDEEFAANVNKILNILEMPKISKVPNAPHSMRGIINLRGEALPVIDLRMKFGMDAVSKVDAACILVLDIFLDGEKVKVGLLVDTVSEVLEIEESEIQMLPRVSRKHNNQYITGMYFHNDGFIMILDMEQLFSIEELNQIQASTDL